MLQDKCFVINAHMLSILSYINLFSCTCINVYQKISIRLNLLISKCQQEKYQNSQWKVTKSTGTKIVGMAVSKHVIGGKDGDQLQNQ